MPGYSNLTPMYFAARASVFFSLQSVQSQQQPQSPQVQVQTAWSLILQRHRYNGPDNLAPLTQDDCQALLFTRDDQDPDGREHRQRMERLISNVQRHLVRCVESMDTKKFEVYTDFRGPEDAMQGGGVAMVLQDGSVFEKAGVNISCLMGPLTVPMLKNSIPHHEELRRYLENRSLEEMAANGRMFAAGISVVMHPVNPNAPTGHCNYRYFEMKLGDGHRIWWFGGGADLTPSLVNEEDAIHFHRTLKDVADKHDPSYYARFKRWCDKYFWIPYRKEARGIGGIFFDDLGDRPKDDLYQFVAEAAENFSTGYLTLVDKHRDEAFGEQHKRWQQLRRGRYVEFNLGFDRGTKFGLALPNPRTENILMSLPLTCRFETRYEPAPGSAEADTLDALRHPRDWIPLEDVEAAGKQ